MVEVSRKSIAQIDGCGCSLPPAQPKSLLNPRLRPEVRRKKVLSLFRASRCLFLPGFCRFAAVPSRQLPRQDRPLPTTGLRVAPQNAAGLFLAARLPAERRRLRPAAIPPDRPPRAASHIGWPGRRAHQKSGQSRHGAVPSEQLVLSVNPTKEKLLIGLAPIAAMSLSPRASVRCPTDSGGCHSRRKCLPSIDKSVVTASSSFGFSRRIAQSSPIPRRNPLLDKPFARPRMRSSSANSPRPALRDQLTSSCRASY